MLLVDDVMERERCSSTYITLKRAPSGIGTCTTDSQIQTTHALAHHLSADKCLLFSQPNLTPSKGLSTTYPSETWRGGNASSSTPGAGPSLCIVTPGLWTRTIPTIPTSCWRIVITVRHECIDILSKICQRADQKYGLKIRAGSPPPHSGDCGLRSSDRGFVY